jgi:hypothetical protein
MVTFFLDSTVSYFAWTNLSVTPDILHSRVIQVMIRVHYQFLIIVSCLVFLVWEGRLVNKNSDHKRCEYSPESTFAIVTFMNASAANKCKRSLTARQRRGWSWHWASGRLGLLLPRSPQKKEGLIRGALRPGNTCECSPQVILEKNATVLSW